MLSSRLNNLIDRLPAIMSVQEAADFFSVSYQTVYRMIRSGQIAAWKDGENNWCIGRADIRRFCAENSNR